MAADSTKILNSNILKMGFKINCQTTETFVSFSLTNMWNTIKLKL